MSKVIEMAGQVFGRLTVLRRGSKCTHSGQYWVCQCQCGVVKEILRGGLTRGAHRSCGCLLRETHTTHGLSNTRIYKRWAQMIKRCENQNAEQYPRYGGRGVKVCSQWHKFAEFFKDMGQPPTQKHSLERIDNNGPYTVSNCYWATPEEQGSNKRNTKWITAFGRTQSQAQWSREVGRSQQDIYHRLKSGLTPEMALSK